MIEAGLPAQVACGGECWRTVRCSGKEFERGVMRQFVACPWAARAAWPTSGTTLSIPLYDQTATLAMPGAQDSQHTAICISISCHRAYRAGACAGQSSCAVCNFFDWHTIGRVLSAGLSEAPGNGQESLAGKFQSLSLHADTKARSAVYYNNWQDASRTSAAYHQVLSSEDRIHSSIYPYGYINLE